jgi:IclR family acetate operon transcriptional repressor
VTKIAQAFDLPKSTAHRLIITLEEEGFLEQNQVTRKYHLGPMIFELSRAFVGRNLLSDVAMPYIQQLAREIGHTVHLSVLSGWDLLVIASQEGSYPVRVGSQVGDRWVPHSTAGGKVLLSALPETQLDEYLRSTGLPSIVQNTITSAEQLKRQLQIVRETGIAFNREESTLGLEAIAAPIKRGEATIAAINLAYPSHLFTKEQSARAVISVKAAARAITEQLSSNPITDAASVPCPSGTS